MGHLEINSVALVLQNMSEKKKRVTLPCVPYTMICSQNNFPFANSKMHI